MTKVYKKELRIGKVNDSSMVVIDIRIYDFSNRRHTEEFPNTIAITCYCDGDMNFTNKSYREIQEIFNKNPENLYISKEDFDKLMEIWGDSEKTNEACRYEAQLKNPRKDVLKSLRTEDETRTNFIKSLKVEDEHQNIQDEFTLENLKDKLNSGDQSYMVLLREEDSLQKNLHKKVEEKTSLYHHLNDLRDKISKLEESIEDRQGHKGPN